MLEPMQQAMPEPSEAKSAMKSFSILHLGCLVALLAGCKASDSGMEREHAVNSWMVNTLKNNAVENAIISQRTLYPYHFVPDSPRLNELGRSDLGVLASHFRRAPGKLCLRRGDACDELYAARSKEVRGLLAVQGVDAEGIEISDGIAGGDGNPSDRVLWGLEKERTAAPFIREGGEGAGGVGVQTTGGSR